MLMVLTWRRFHRHASGSPNGAHRRVGVRHVSAPANPACHGLNRAADANMHAIMREMRATIVNVATTTRDLHANIGEYQANVPQMQACIAEMRACNHGL